MKYQFDDIAGLQAIVSETWSDWGKEFEVTQEVINQFADLTGDHYFLHVDKEAAAKGPFKTTIAHGFLTLALMPRLTIPNWHEIVGFKTMVNYGSNKLRFTGIVPSGSKIHMRTRCISVTPAPKGPGTQVTSEFAIHVVGQDRPALLYEMIILYM